MGGIVDQVVLDLACAELYPPTAKAPRFARRRRIGVARGFPGPWSIGPGISPVLRGNIAGSNDGVTFSASRLPCVSEQNKLRGPMGKQSKFDGNAEAAGRIAHARSTRATKL